MTQNQIRYMDLQRQQTKDKADIKRDKERNVMEGFKTVADVWEKGTKGFDNLAGSAQKSAGAANQGLGVASGIMKLLA